MANIIYFFKTKYLNVELNHTEPSHQLVFPGSTDI